MVPALRLVGTARRNNPNGAVFLSVAVANHEFFREAMAPRPDRSEFRKNAEFQKLFAGRGEPEGDVAVIARVSSRPIGAAWNWSWSPEVHSHGFVDFSVPELGIGVNSAHRSKGVGRALLVSLISTAESAQVPASSLSVSPANFALHLFESLGCQRVGESGTSLTLLLRVSA